MKRSNHMRCWAALLCASLSGAVQASYVMQCSISGTVVSVPQLSRTYVNEPSGQKVEREILTFQLKTHRATSNGRADNDCAKTFNGKRIDVLLDAAISWAKPIQKNDRLTLNYIAKDSGAVARWERFSLPLN